MRRIITHFIKLAFLITVLLPSICFAGARMSDRSDVKDFIQYMVNQYGFNGPALVNLFNQVKVQRSILDLMNQPKEASPWYRYQTFFITDKRINDGVKFWNEHANTLARAQQQYGVPASVIVAIIGVETHYGTYLGKYRVIDALSTLAFDYPSRAKFFKNELAQYLLLAREQNFNPLSVTGSYAGAIGMPQFMPSSYRSYAVSHNGSHKIDLSNNPDDAIISVANYFKNYGWQSGQPVVMPAKIISNRYQKILSKSLAPKYTMKQLEQYGVKPVRYTNVNKACLIQLQGEQQPQYWLGFNNFSVIAQYNPSVNYSMAVYQLGQQIASQRDHQLTRVADKHNPRNFVQNKIIQNPAVN